MVNAEWLFKNHKNHLALLKLLQSTATPGKAYPGTALRDEDIEGMALQRRPLDGMPHLRSGGSSTERVVFAMDGPCNGQVNGALDGGLAAIKQYQQYLDLFDFLMECLNPKERWLVNNYYLQGESLSGLTSRQNSPYYGYAKSSLWRVKERLVQKSDELLSSL